MGRLEKYRSIRLYKRRCRRIIFFAFLLAIAGILLADYSINGIMGESAKIGIISVETDDSKLEVRFMNMKFYADTRFLSKFADRINILK